MNHNYWHVAERTNGRLAMIGLFALIINYGFFGWIIPGIYQQQNVVLLEIINTYHEDSLFYPGKCFLVELVLEVVALPSSNYLQGF